MLTALANNTPLLPQKGETDGALNFVNPDCPKTRILSLLENIVRVINERKDDLFAYLHIPNCPNSTNLIELYNSHLQGRLKTIKGFESFASARTWLNAYLIRRRTKPFTDCDEKFKHLNKHACLELTIKKQARWPDSLTKLGVKKVKYFKVKKS